MKKTKKRYDFWPFSSSSDDDDRSPSPNNACVLVAFFFFLERLNARRRRARRHLCTNRSARAQRQKAVASCRRTRYGETPARRLKRETKDDKRTILGKRQTTVVVLSLSKQRKEVENRTIFYQKPPFKNEEKREKQRTHRCEQRGGGGRGDGRLGELLRQVGRLDRLVDRTVSKGEERAIGERAAKRFIRGEAFIGPKNKEDKILMMMDEEEKKRTIKKKRRIVIRPKAPTRDHRRTVWTKPSRR